MWNRGTSALALIILLFSLPLGNSIEAAAGDLDLSFGNGGKVITDFFGNSDFGNAIDVQSDGRIVVAGSSIGDNTSAFSDFALARYNPNGSLDSSFGVGGKVITDFGEDEAVSAIAIQPDGKIMAAGSIAGKGAASIDFLIARYNPDGSLDATFGEGGRVRTDFSSSRDEIIAATLQPDGKIVAVGFISSNFSTTGVDYALARYNGDGSLDSTFDKDGKVTTDSGNESFDFAMAVAIDSNGKIVVAGQSSLSNGIQAVDFSLARYNSDGTLDPTFGTNGIVTTDLGTPQDGANGVLIQPDGKIIAGGTAREDFPIGANFALARYLPNGALDPSFGSGGKVITDFSGRSDIIRGIALQTDGRIVAAGASALDFSFDFALAQYLANGALDSSFGAGGKVITDITIGEDFANAVALQHDGKIVVAGRTFDVATAFNFTVVRYNGSTTLDICLQDDRVGNSLQINSTTGDYVFNNCDTNSTLSGRGSITTQGCVITLRHRTPDRNLQASVNTCLQRGNAVVSTFSPGSFSLTGIDDSNTADNSCACR
jgi:uncharacterized delta-60 repeat protein